MRIITSKSVIARDFVVKSKCMFGGRTPPGLLRELPRPHFHATYHNITITRLTTELRPDPPVELERSPDTLAAVGAMEGNTL
jgi:hypothetical protein